MKTTKQVMREARQLFRVCLVDGRLDEGRARLVVQRVIQSRHRGYLTLLGHFKRLLKFEYERFTARVESALTLPADLEATVRAELAGVYGLGITTLFARNPALIGGMRIQVGSDVYDGSVQSGLAALEKRFGITSVNGRNTENSSAFPRPSPLAEPG
jgi:F-type H+-transporting ATPase subunit delta